MTTDTALGVTTHYRSLFAFLLPLLAHLIRNNSLIEPLVPLEEME
jgi:hypothetical protein